MRRGGGDSEQRTHPRYEAPLRLFGGFSCQLGCFQGFDGPLGAVSQCCSGAGLREGGAGGRLGRHMEEVEDAEKIEWGEPFLLFFSSRLFSLPLALFSPHLLRLDEMRCPVTASRATAAKRAILVSLRIARDRVFFFPEEN